MDNKFPVNNDIKLLLILDYDWKGIKRLLNQDSLSGCNKALCTLLANFCIIKIPSGKHLGSGA